MNIYMSKVTSVSHLKIKIIKINILTNYKQNNLILFYVAHKCKVYIIARSGEINSSDKKRICYGK